MKKMESPVKKHTKSKLIRRSLPLFAVSSISALSIGASLIVAPSLARAVGEQDGRISGIVTDKQTGIPMPGVRVRLTGKYLLGGPRITATSDDGSYEFIALTPGPYEVELSIEGLQVKPMRKRIVVRQGETFPLNVAWTPEEQRQETLVVKESYRVIRPDNTQTGTVLTADQQSRVATSRSYQGITQQVAGVTGGGNPNIKGAMNAHNRYLVDGLDITDPVTNTFSANMNFDSIESVDVATGGTEAEYNSLGGVVNLTTSAGSNEWHVDSSFYVNHQDFSAGNQFGAQGYDGVRPFARLKKSPNAGYQANLNLSGPILKNRWWFHTSFQYEHRDASINIGPPLNLQHPTREFRAMYFRFKTAFQPSQSHRLTLSVSADPAFISNVNQDNLHLGVAEDHQNQGGAFGILQWDYFINERMNSKIQAGIQYSTIDTGPQGFFGSIDNSAYAGSGKFDPINDTWDPMRSKHTNNDDGTYWHQGDPITYDRRVTLQLDPSFSIRGNFLGKHEAKFGFQGRYIFHSSDTQIPGNLTYSDAGGGPGEGGLCWPEKMQTAGCYQRTRQDPYTNQQTGFSTGLFVQDRWKVNSWLRINPGVRFDYGRSTNSEGVQVSSLWGFGPRLGLVFDLTQDQKTVLTAYYGRSNEVLSLLAAAYADASAKSTTEQYDPDTKQWKKLYEGGGSYFDKFPAYDVNPSSTPPHTDEITLSFRREVFENSTAGIDYTYKRVGNIWDSQEINQVWDPSGQRVVSYLNGNEQQIFRYATFDRNFRIYQGVDFQFEARPSPNWDFGFVYTLSFLYGPGAEQFAQVSGSQAQSQFYNPRLNQFFDGYLPEDRRHQLKLRASYNYKGFNVGAFLGYQSGTALTKRFFNSFDGGYTYRRSPTGTEPGNDAANAGTFNDVARIAEFRIPALLTMDVRMSWDVGSLFTEKIKLTLIADIFNVFNLDAANTGANGTNLENRDVPTFGQVRSRQTPLRAQLGLRFQY